MEGNKTDNTLASLGIHISPEYILLPVTIEQSARVIPIVVLVFILRIQISHIAHFWNYGIPLSQAQTKYVRSNYRRKFLCLILMTLLSAFSSCFNISFASCFSLVILVLTLAKTYFEFHFKLSVNKTKTFLEGDNFIAAILLLGAIFDFSHDILVQKEWAGSLNHFLLWLIFLTIFLSSESNQPTGFFSTISKFYPLRAYLLPSTQSEKIYLFLFGVVTAIGSVVSFYGNIYKIDVVNSLQLMNVNNSNSSVTSSSVFTDSTVSLQVTWKLIIVAYWLQFFNSDILSVGRGYIQECMEKDCCSKLQMALFSKLQAVSLRWHLENQTNGIYATIASSPNILKDIISSLFYLIPTLINMLVTLVYMLQKYGFKVSSVCIFSTTLIALISYRYLKRRDKTLKGIQENAIKTRSLRDATFENYETMHYFNNAEYERSTYAKAYFEEAELLIKEYVVGRLFSSGKEFIKEGTELLVLLLILKSIISSDNGLTTGDYMYFSTAFASIIAPVRVTIEFYRRLQEKAANVEQVAKVMELVPEILDDPNAPDLKVDSNTGSIQFINVNFAYTPGRNVFKNLNLNIPAGKTVGIVGRSGSGKSTFAKLLFRFYDPTDGEILINGQNIRKVKCESLRRVISVVPQEVVLFSGTIKFNIQYANWNATAEEIENSAKAASLHERINTFPDKYETKVGNRGLKLSGGEKQRLAIARSILKNKPILVLDEATSSLDSETEKEIQAALEELNKNRTTIIITHRLSTVVNVHTILVFKDGRVVESGCHSDLLRKNGVYTSMWNQQYLDQSEPCSCQLL